MDIDPPSRRLTPQLQRMPMWPDGAAPMPANDRKPTVDEMVEHIGDALDDHPVQLLSLASATVNQFHDWTSGRSQVGALGDLSPMIGTVEHDSLLCCLSVLAPLQSDREWFEARIEAFTVRRWKRLAPWLRNIGEVVCSDGVVDDGVPCHFLQVDLGYWLHLVLIVFLSPGTESRVDDVVAVPSNLFKLMTPEDLLATSFYDPSHLVAALRRTDDQGPSRETATWPHLRPLLEWALRDAHTWVNPTLPTI